MLWDSSRLSNPILSLSVCRVAGIAIQKLLRGHFARRRAERLAQTKAEVEHVAMLHHFVVLIQRNFRGFRSRKYRHDFYARKLYISGIKDKSEVVRTEMAEARQKQLQVRELVPLWW